MGKGRRKPWGRNKAKFEKGGGNVWRDDRNNQNQKGVRQNYEDIVKENKDFEKYYKLQKICPDEEWETFMSSLRLSLPTTFRITETRAEAKALLHILEDNLIRDAVMAGKTDDQVDIKPFPLPWYPTNFAWQLNLTRKDIRRNESYFRLHNFLVSETESGNISRQEAVSMIPPLALDVEPHHKVLDMCAAPGSKTAQIIEVLQKDEFKESEGLLVSNDVDNKRCYMLVHQAKRLQSPAFLITNHDAGGFPDIFCTAKDGSKELLQFDRILADVPCSGDGTIRKNIDVWRKWSTSNAYALHNTQTQILKRGLELLKVGGKIVYSTCSLNPIENEAVVHRVLKESQGSVQLLDINLPYLRHSPGIHHWVPCYGKDITPYNTPEEVPEKLKTTVHEHLFPPSEAEASGFHLEKCMRVLAHQQDTGNFFIALLTKTGDLPWQKDSKQTTTVSESANGSADAQAEPAKNGDATKEDKPSGKRHADKFSRQNAKKLRGFREDPYIFLDDADPIWGPIKEFYSLEDLKSANFLTRSAEGKKRNIYFATNLVKDIVINNESTVKIINTGVKVLARCGQNNKWTAADFRLAQEGLKSLLPYLKGRRVNITKEDLVNLLTNEDETKPPLLASFSPEAQSQLLPLPNGSCVLVINCQVDDGPEFCLHLVGWRGAASLRAYVPKQERMHYIRLCGGDVSKFETNKFQERLIVAAADVNEPEDELEQAEEEEDAAENEDIIEGMDEESGAAVETS